MINNHGLSIVPRACTLKSVPLLHRKGYFGCGSKRVYGVIVDIWEGTRLDGGVDIIYQVLTDKLEYVTYLRAAPDGWEGNYE